MVLTWFKAGEGYVPSYATGMRTVFFADTSVNPWGWHVFGNSDMKASMPSKRVALLQRGLSDHDRALDPVRERDPNPIHTVCGHDHSGDDPTDNRRYHGGKDHGPGHADRPGRDPEGHDTSGRDAPSRPRPRQRSRWSRRSMTAGLSSSRRRERPLRQRSRRYPRRRTRRRVAATTTFPAGNQTGTITPFPTESPAPTTTGYDRTTDWSVSTGLDYTSDLDDAGTATATPTATATANATESPAASIAATPAVTTALPPPPAFTTSPASTTTPSDQTSSRSISFTFSFQVRESGNGPAINASSRDSAATVSPTSPLGALWAFLKAVASLIDPFFT